MDINTRLENEVLFDSQSSKGKNRIIALNERGIFTVEDFINCDITNITKTSYIRSHYIAIQYALKYKYNGEPLVTDVLLDRNFRVPRSKIALGSHYDFYIRAMAKLGFENYSMSQIGKKILVNKMKENDDYYSHRIAANGGIKQEYYNVSMMEILKVKAQSGDKLAQFYVDYQEQKSLEEGQQKSNTEILEKLKNEIVSLTAQRDKLDDKIRQLTEQVQKLEGGNISNGRK